MRTFALLLLLTMPPLVICSAAYAKTSEIGKPVCTHYDDAAKSAQQSAIATASTNPVAATVAAPTIATTAPPGTSARNASAQPKTGGTSGMMRPHDAPRWQTFLPGMFK